MSASPLEYLRHILDETTYLLSTSRQMTKAVFLGDDTLKRAFVRSLEIIGEATKKIPANMKDNYPSLEWRLMAACLEPLWQQAWIKKSRKSNRESRIDESRTTAR